MMMECYHVILLATFVRSIEIEYVGCYTDFRGSAFPDGPHVTYMGTMVLRSCSTACLGYDYFGLQNGGWCACGDDLDQAQRFGQYALCEGAVDAYNLYHRVSASHIEQVGCYKEGTHVVRYSPGFNTVECGSLCFGWDYFGIKNGGVCLCSNNLSDMQKNGKSLECKGGPSAFDLYHNDIDWTYLGCFQDHNTAEKPRALNVDKGYRWNAEQCNFLCCGYRLFALQDNGQCFCSNDLTAATQYGELNENECIREGDLVDNCGFQSRRGGGWANSLFENNNCMWDPGFKKCQMRTCPDIVIVGEAPLFGHESSHYDFNDYVIFIVSMGIILGCLSVFVVLCLCDCLEEKGKSAKLVWDSPSVCVE
eukprot:762033_1